MDLTWLLAYLRNELRVVKEAPFAFVLWAALFVGGTYLVIGRGNDQEVASLHAQIGTLQERVNLREDQLADVNKKLSLAQEAVKTRTTEIGEKSESDDSPPDIVIPEPVPSGQFGLEVLPGRPVRLDALSTTVKNKTAKAISYRLSRFEVDVGNGTIVSTASKETQTIQPGETVKIVAETKFHEDQFTKDSFVLRYTVKLFYGLDDKANSFYRYWSAICLFEKGKSDATNCAINYNSDSSY